MTNVLIPQGGTTSFYSSSHVAALGCGSSYPANHSMAWHVAGTFSNMYVNVKTNTCNADTTGTIYINSSSGNETLFIAAYATGEFQDTTHTDTISSGDTMGYYIPNANNEIDTTTLCTNFAPATTGNTVVKYISTGITVSQAIGSYFNAPGGICSAIYGNENYAAFNMKTAGANQNLYAYVSSNARTSATSVTSRVNYGGGNLTVTIPSTNTGVFEDTTHTDSVFPSDTMDFASTATSDGSTDDCDIYIMGCEFLTTNGETHYISGINDTSEVISYNVTNYTPIMGTGVISATTTESEAQVKSTLSLTTSLLQAYVGRNDLDSATTVKMRVASADGNETLSVSAGASGLFTDSTHTDSVVSGNELDYKFSTTGSSSGVIAPTSFGVLASYASASPVSDAIWFGMTF